MTTAPKHSTPSARPRFAASPARPRSAAQRGVVLIIALVMLVVISMLTALSIRSAISTESVSGNVRTTELASQAAEIALRYCEDSVVQINSGTVTFAVTPTILAFQDPPRWKSAAATWDVNPSQVFVVPATQVNQAVGTATYRRPPECIVERMPVVTAAGALSVTSTYVITSRGFGPEVPAADAARSRPHGSEVWMQSTIELQ